MEHVSVKKNETSLGLPDPSFGDAHVDFTFFVIPRRPVLRGLPAAWDHRRSRRHRAPVRCGDGAGGRLCARWFSTWRHFCKTNRELGWNDLVFQWVSDWVPKEVTSGSGTPSNHTFGLAVDINNFENPPRPRARKDGKIVGPWLPAFTALDPRVVALFESFGVTWGRCICSRGSDPMHFDIRVNASTKCG